jgi:LmbE family N-acetylglucosaminyl deacetylase
MNELTYMFIGAHPDDADIQFGGTAILLKDLGYRVIFVSLTDGSAGHQVMARQELAERRYAEAQKVAAFLGIEYVVMDGVDGELTPNLENRRKLMALIRMNKPDVIISPRPVDYHPDHRAVSQLVQDCSFLLTVPLISSEVPHMDRMPYIFHHQDDFQKPAEFVPDILVDITPIIDRKMASLAHHESQVFEWLPFIRHTQAAALESHEDRIEFLKRHWGDPGRVSRFRSLLENPHAEYIEAFERCEYGADVTEDIAQQLFPFARLNFTV